jgi:hypothetical protein
MEKAMNRVQHASNNAVLGAPPGATIEECNALPITRLQFADGTHACASYWQPSREELALLAAGRSVRLCVMGLTHAPVQIGVDGDGALT